MSTRRPSDARATRIDRDAATSSSRPFAGGEKPTERWRIGTEHEKFVYRARDHHAPVL